MGWIYRNINPAGKSVGDCTVRAIAIATGQEWETTFIKLMVKAFSLADMPSANVVTTAYLRNNGFRRYTIPDSFPEDYTIKDFCLDHPNGTFVLGTGTHMVAVISGNYIDSWDSGSENPAYYFEKEGE